MTYSRPAILAALLGIAMLPIAASQASPPSPYGASAPLTLSNSTPSTLAFEIASGGTASQWRLPARRVLEAQCQTSANITVKTEDRAYAVTVPCGGAYQLYYDAGLKQYAVSAVSRDAAGPGASGLAGNGEAAAASLPAPAGEASPLQQLLTNQAGALAARANAAAPGSGGW